MKGDIHADNDYQGEASWVLSVLALDKVCEHEKMGCYSENRKFVVDFYIVRTQALKWLSCNNENKVKNAKKHIALDLEDWILHRVKA